MVYVKKSYVLKIMAYCVIVCICVTFILLCVAFCAAFTESVIASLCTFIKAELPLQIILILLVVFGIIITSCFVIGIIRYMAKPLMDNIDDYFDL